MKDRLKLIGRLDETLSRQQVWGGIVVPLALCVFLLPSVAFAVSDVLGFLDVLIAFVSALVPILIGCAVIVFFWGIIKFIAHAGDEKATTEGKQFILWGLVGLFVIVALWAIVGYLQESLGIGVSVVNLTAPSTPTIIP